MELEELKKSWNVLDEHLKDKELIKKRNFRNCWDIPARAFMPLPI